MSASVTLRPIGDVELWLAQAEDRSWRLPLHVEWKMDDATQALYAMVLPGVCFYETQLAVMRDLLSGFSISENQDRWLVPRDILPTLLSKAPGIHAAFYYHWPGGMHPPIPSPLHSVSLTDQRQPIERFDEFAQYVHRERGIPKDVVNVVLAALSQLGPRWMLRKRKPLDLGFVKLVALPFRSNWKEIVCFKLKTEPLQLILGKLKTARNRMLHVIGFPKIVASTHNIGLRMQTNSSRMNRLNYTIEALTTKRFEDACQEEELERMKPGETSYVGHYEWTVQEHYETIQEIIQQYLRKSSVPWAAVRLDRNTGLLSFHPRQRNHGKLGHGADVANIPVHVVAPDPNFSVFADQPGACDPTLLHPENPTLQPLSAVPSSPYDVRQPEVKRGVVEPRSSGANGVPLLDAGEVPGSGGGVFSHGSTEEPGASRMEAT
jgi:hypothetical protein